MDNNTREQINDDNNTSIMKNIMSNFQTNDTTPSNSYFSNLSTTSWIFISIAAVFIILNIITYFSSGIQNLTLDMDSGFKKIFGIFTLIFGKAIGGTAGVAKDIIGGTADVLDTGLTEIQNDVTPKDSSTSLTSQSVSSQQNSQSSPQSNQSPSQQNTQQIALNNTFSVPFSQSQSSSQSNYEASSAQSTINSTGKSAWCYVGEDRGFRSCAQVGANEQCMSGDIFPTNELCINPNLRQ